jgi:cyclic-di-GMP phosphodiesterase, flagellum assembly factor TipF
MRFTTIFIATCMAAIAASAGATVYLSLGASGMASTIVALVVLATSGFCYAFSNQLNLPWAFNSQMGALSRGNFELTRQLTDLSRRLASLESRVETAQNRARSTADPLAVEISELGTLVRQLAETVASYEARFGEIAKSVAARPMPAAEPAAVQADEAAANMAPPETATPGAPLPPALATDAKPETKPKVTIAEMIAADVERLAEIRLAIETNRIDLYLQPIVTLPQRKVRYYEAMSRLRTETGDVIAAADFVPQAQRAGMMAKIDNLVVFRCVQIVRRLLLKNRDIGLFCNLSEAALTDAAIFQQLLDFLEANRAIASSLVLEFTQSTLRSLGPLESESLSALAEVGFRFSLDNLQDLRIEPRELAARGFRYVKVPGSLLLDPKNAASDIHPADLADLLSRSGIDLIAERVESESMAVDLLDCGPRFGQGFLFSPPRPVRAEALQSFVDGGNLGTRDGGAPQPQVAPALEQTAAARNRVEPPTAAANTPRTTGLAQLARGVVGRI